MHVTKDAAKTASLLLITNKRCQEPERDAAQSSHKDISPEVPGKTSMDVNAGLQDRLCSPVMLKHKRAEERASRGSVSQTQTTQIKRFYTQATMQHILTEQMARISFKYHYVMSAAGPLPLVSLYARAWSPSLSAADSALFRDQTAADPCGAAPHLWLAIRACHVGVSHERQKKGQNMF
jgi:hypothetical protein